MVPIIAEYIKRLETIENVYNGVLYKKYSNTVKVINKKLSSSSWQEKFGI